MDGIELPVGSLHKVVVDGRPIVVEVVENWGCTGCVFEGRAVLCFAMLCAETRRDHTPVSFREVKGGVE